MDKQQAAKIIDSALAQMALSRKDHELLQQALQVLLKGEEKSAT